MTTITMTEDRSTQFELLTQLRQGVYHARRELAVHGPRSLSETVARVTPLARPEVERTYEFTAAPPVEDVDTLLSHRSSQRFFADLAVDPRVLAAALLEAVRADRACWPEDEPVDLLVVVNSVTGMEPGLYRVQPAESIDAVTFNFLQHISRQDIAEMVLQLEFAHAPAIIMAVASLEAHLQRWGDHGEPLMNRRAGQAVASALLNAQRRGAAGQIFAGCLPSGLARHLTVDGYYRAQLLAAVIGHPWTA